MSDFTVAAADTSLPYRHPLYTLLLQSVWTRSCANLYRIMNEICYGPMRAFAEGSEAGVKLREALLQAAALIPDYDVATQPNAFWLLNSAVVDNIPIDMFYNDLCVRAQAYAAGMSCPEDQYTGEHVLRLKHLQDFKLEMVGNRVVTGGDVEHVACYPTYALPYAVKSLAENCVALCQQPNTPVYDPDKGWVAQVYKVQDIQCAGRGMISHLMIQIEDHLVERGNFQQALQYIQLVSALTHIARAPIIGEHVIPISFAPATLPRLQAICDSFEASERHALLWHLGHLYRGQQEDGSGWPNPSGYIDQGAHMRCITPIALEELCAGVQRELPLGFAWPAADPRRERDLRLG